MPLRALLDGQSVVASDLSDAEWATLRGAPLRMPCCDGAAIARVSPRGLRHFAHKGQRPATGCVSPAESEDHLRAKAEIVAACRAAGYAATSEYPAADGSWRADVLAVCDDTRIAFEVQLTQQSVGVTRERERRYAAAGIRTCWLVDGKGRSATSEPDAHFVTADPNLPAFRLYMDATGAFQVGVAPDFIEDAEPSLPLTDFVVAYLQRRVQFSTHLVGRGTVPVRVTMFPYRCPKCRAYSQVYDVAYASPWIYMSACGRPLAPSDNTTWIDAAADPAIVSAVQAYLDSPNGGGPWLADFRRSASRRGRAGAVAFACYRCHRPFPPKQFEVYICERRQCAPDASTGQIEIQVSGDAISVSNPHWCLTEHGDPCAPRRPHG